MKRIIVPVLASMLSFAALADSHNGKSQPFLGLGLGYSHQDFDGGDRDGMNIGIKGVYSMQNTHWFVDPGIGFQLETLNGNEDILTTSAFGEIDARYKFSESFSFGPMTSLQFGGNQSRNDDDSGSSTLWMGGVRAMMHMNTDSGRPWRIEANVQRSFAGDGDAELYTVNLGVQFGFPWEEPVKAAPACAPCHAQPAAQVRLRPGKVHFAFDSDEVTPKNQDKLGDLSRVIKKRQSDIEMIRVEGHADERGSDDYNQNLSERRAESVKNELVKNGVDESKIQAKGYGESRPLDTASTEEAWAKNRRTDIKFYGLKKNREEFKRELREAGSDAE